MFNSMSDVYIAIEEELGLKFEEITPDIFNNFLINKGLVTEEEIEEDRKREILLKSE